MTTALNCKCLGVVLAGGRSSRMGGGDKFLLNWQGKTLLNHCIERAQAQVDQLVISANGDLTRLASTGLPVLADRFGAFGGPLGGVLSAMAWAKESGQSFRWVASFASDTPRFPQQCTLRLLELAIQRDLQVAFARTHSGAHYTFALWSLAIYPDLLALHYRGERALKRAINHFVNGPVDFADDTCFYNVNTPDDWHRLQQGL